MRKLIFVMLVFFAVSVWADSYEYDKALLIKDVVKEIKRNSGKAKKETDAPYIYATVTVTNNRQEGAREEALSACKSMLLNQFLEAFGTEKFKEAHSNTKPKSVRPSILAKLGGTIIDSEKITQQRNNSPFTDIMTCKISVYNVQTIGEKELVGLVTAE